MSQWTHINGVLSFNSYVYLLNENKKYIPFPSKQLKLTFPHLIESRDAKAIYFNLDIFSLPKCESEITNEINILPSGEFDCISYSLYQDEHGFSSSSAYLNSWEEDAFKKCKDSLVKKLSSKNLRLSNLSAFKSIKDLKNQLKDKELKIDLVNYCDEFNLTLKDDVRWCSGPEFAYYIEKFLRSLIKKEIIPASGYVEWADEYDNNLYTLRATWEGLKFIIYDKDTYKEIAHNNIKLIYNWNKKDDDFISFEVDKSNNWIDYEELE